MCGLTRIQIESNPARVSCLTVENLAHGADVSAAAESEQTEIVQSGMRAIADSGVLLENGNGAWRIHFCNGFNVVNFVR
jgi:hypothetical protein